MADRTSKYFPLHRYFLGQTAVELPLSFHDVEQVLGFALPPSARTHPAWWSNNPGTNVAVKAWRDAGWRTSRVDIPAERVTFVREAAGRGSPSRLSEHRRTLSEASPIGAQPSSMRAISWSAAAPSGAARCACSKTTEKRMAAISAMQLPPS